MRDHPSWSHLVGLITGWRWSRISGFYKHGALESLDIVKWGTGYQGSTLAQRDAFKLNDILAMQFKDNRIGHEILMLIFSFNYI